MKDKKLFNLVFPTYILLLFPAYFILALLISMLIAIISLIISFFNLKNVKDKHKLFKENILKVWVISLITDFIGFGILYLSKYIMPNISYYVLYNPYKSAYSMIYVIITILIVALISLCLNIKYVFKNIKLKNKQRFYTCLIIVAINLPYSFLLPNTSNVYSTASLQQFIQKNKDIKITDDSISNIFLNSYQCINANYGYKDVKYQVDSKSNALIVNMVIDQDKILPKFDEYEKCIKYSSLVTLACAKDGQEVVVYLYDKNNNPIIKKEYTRLDFEKEYNNSKLEDLVKNSDQLIDIITGKG